jgi:photosystem II stability/assembly factor-like uncharacterized protein
VLLALALLVSCSTRNPGSWVVVSTGTGNSFFSVNFVNDQIGWLNGQSGRNPDPDENDNANANANKKSPAAKNTNKNEATLQTNQGFEVLQTTDGGETWKPLVEQFKNKIRAVWFVDPREGWALTVDRDILHSTDQGSTWALQRKAGIVELRLPGNRREPVMKQPEQIEHVHFVDNSHGWAWGGGRNDEHAVQPGIFLVTVDGGQNWTSVRFPFDQNCSDLFFLDSLHGWASSEGASFYRTTDGGLNWTKIEAKLPEDVFRSIFFTDPNNGWVVGRSGRLAKTADSGRTWKKMYQIKDEFKMRDVFFLDKQHGWVVGEAGAILYTPDAGESWSSIPAPIPARLIDVAFVDGRIGWAAGLSGALLKLEPQ